MESTTDEDVPLTEINENNSARIDDDENRVSSAKSISPFKKLKKPKKVDTPLDEDDGLSRVPSEITKRKSREKKSRFKDMESKANLKDASARSSEGSVKIQNKKPVSAKKGKKARFVGETGEASDKEQECPDGLIPIFLTIRTQEHFGLRIDEDVTKEDPQKFILKKDVMSDLQDFGPSSDFYPIKKLIQDYTAEEFLIAYDHEYKYGQNFYIAVSEDAKNFFTRDSLTSEMDDFVSFELVVGAHAISEAKEWTSQGSEKEISEWAVVNSRDHIKMLFKRDWKHFNAPTHFSDVNAADSKNFIDISSSGSNEEKQEADLKRMEIDVAVQAVPSMIERAVSKVQGLPLNKIIQCNPREMTDEEANKLMESQGMLDFFRRVTPRIDKALQQNHILDVFFDDWSDLVKGQSNFAAKSERHLKEYQSYTDLQYGKSRAVSCIVWHPTISNIVAVSLIDNISLYERIEQAHKQITTPSLILFWSFTDPIHPILLLECPDQILCFQFCPSNPVYIAGGCFNGQLVLWDIGVYHEKLRSSTSSKKKNVLQDLSAEFDWTKASTTVRFCAVSSYEHSHSMPITDIIWIPSFFEIGKFGYMFENKMDQNVQIMTCAVDHPSLRREKYMVKLRQEGQQRKRWALANMQMVGTRGPAILQDMKKKNMDDACFFTDEEQIDLMPGSILFWDIRTSKGIMPSGAKKDLREFSLTSTVFKHLDLTWKPFLKVSTVKAEVGTDLAPLKFSIQSTINHKNNEKKDQVLQTEKQIMPGKGITSKFFLGTEEGEVLYLDWIPQKDQESGKYQTQKPIFCYQAHTGPVVSMERSPFFNDVVLSVGGWNFAIWQEGVNTGPILSGSGSMKRLTAGYWSISRPSVFYTAKVDGSIDIWDLLDRTHEPCYTQIISTSQLTKISTIQVNKQLHLLAAGDENGTLHLFELPWSLSNPSVNELQNMQAYLAREVKRQSYVLSRWKFRDDERAQKEMEVKMMLNQAIPAVVLTDEEVEQRDRKEYETYLEEEQLFLKQMGLIEEVLLPSVFVV